MYTISIDVKKSAFQKIAFLPVCTTTTAGISNIIELRFRNQNDLDEFKKIVKECLRNEVRTLLSECKSSRLVQMVMRIKPECTDGACLFGQQWIDCKHLTLSMLEEAHGILTMPLLEFAPKAVASMLHAACSLCGHSKANVPIAFLCGVANLNKDQTNLCAFASLLSKPGLDGPVSRVLEETLEFKEDNLFNLFLKVFDKMSALQMEVLSGLLDLRHEVITFTWAYQVGKAMMAEKDPDKLSVVRAFLEEVKQ